MAITTSVGANLANLASRGNLKALRDLLLEYVGQFGSVVAGTVTGSQAVVVSATKTITGFLLVTSTAFAGFWTVPRATVAATGSTNADAAQLALGFTNVSAADGTKGVLLPVPAAGSIVLIKNNTAAVLKIYPGTGAAINALAATTGGMSIASLTSVIVVGDSATQWFTIPLLPS